MIDKAKGSVGLTETKIVRISLPEGGLQLECGKRIKELDVAYETYGTLNAAKDNAVFICHALSGDAHAAGYHEKEGENPGWWDNMIGAGRGIDTNHYFVICANILGGCKGTTGPSSVNPETGKPYGSLFPQISVSDIVDVNHLLVRYLGIDKLAGVIGGSFGGMQAMDWAIRYPDMVERSLCIASTARLSAQALAFDIVGRKAIMADPNWQNGDYYGTGKSPDSGLSTARMIGHITYLSHEMMTKKFGREKKAVPAASGGNDNAFASDFQVENYLTYQGNKFIARFDANSYLHITRALDEFDLLSKYGSLKDAFAPIKARMLIVALSTDWLFPANQAHDVAKALLEAGKNVTYCKLNVPSGHDAFLVDVDHLSELLHAFLPWIRTKPDDYYHGPERTPSSMVMRRDYDYITSRIKPGARVLDLGCGEGKLLSILSERVGAKCLGVDIDLHNMLHVIDIGHDVLQGDIDEGLSMIPSGSYDYAILGDTLQLLRKPKIVLREMLRIAEEGIVSFPNVGRLANRLHLLFSGQIREGFSIPSDWYETPGMHLLSVQDFIELCASEGIKILEVTCVANKWWGRLLSRVGLCKLFAEHVMVRITMSKKRTEI